MRGTPHLQPLPDRSPFLYPGWQVAGRGAGHRDLISRTDRSLNQIPYAYGHTIHSGLGNNKNARGFSRRGKGGGASANVALSRRVNLPAPIAPVHAA